MKLRSNLLIRQIGDQYITVVKSAIGLDYTSVITLNESAANLIRAFLGEELDIIRWAEFLVNNYDVTDDQARKDVELLFEKLSQTGLVEE